MRIDNGFIRMIPLRSECDPEVLDTGYPLLEQAGGRLSNQGRGHQSFLA